MESTFEHCSVLDPSGLGEVVSGIYPPEDSAGHDQYVDVGRWHQSSFPSRSGNRVSIEATGGPKVYDTHACRLDGALFKNGLAL